jgi:nitrous oxidase accessory protein
MYSLRLEIERSVLAGARGAAGVGLGFKDSDAVVVRGSWLVANTAGIYFDNTPRTPNDPVVVEGNLLALNEVGMRFHALSGGQSLRRNEFRNNAVLVEVDGGGDALSADARGNCFSDYEGYDLDGDGVGDVPHEVRALSSQLTESRPSLKLLDGTAAMALLDAVARAVPVFTSKKLFVDPAPLSRCPPMSEP